jgi:carboxymethylenebutenolidase
MPTNVVLSVAMGSMPGYLAEATPAKGAVIVIQEAFGVTSHIESICNRLASAGWTAIAPALFHRQGSPVLSYDSFEAVMPHLDSLTQEGITADIEATLAHLQSRGFDAERTAILGFCLGGTVACFSAARWKIGAAITFYGAGITTGRFGLPALQSIAARLQTPWLGLYGDNDTGIPVEEVETLRDTAEQSAVETNVIRYPTAGHAFNNNDRADRYDKDASADAWERALSWLDTHATS